MGGVCMLELNPLVLVSSSERVYSIIRTYCSFVGRIAFQKLAMTSC